MKKRLLTGIQSSGALHIGNYFGALAPFLDMYEQYESFLMVADYHALTTLRDPVALARNTGDVVRDYVAAGVDPTKALIFKQSDVPEHTELAWILDCLVSVPFLMQAHAYKDKVAKGIEPNAGLFTYPMLMAADILLYDTDVVPVGADQRQHVEYAREAAAKFNRAFFVDSTPSSFGGNYAEMHENDLFFKEPQEKILETVATVPGTDGRKMSKSYGNTIPLFGTKDEIAKAVMSIVTDSTGDYPANVYAIHRLVADADVLDALYEQHRGKYKHLKEALIEDLDDFVAPLRERRALITESDVKNILREGGERAHAIAALKMAEVRKRVGVSV